MLPPAELLATWNLTEDGGPWRGYRSTVWPVRDPDGRAPALKVPDSHHPPSGEGHALRRWAEAGSPVVGLVDHRGAAVLMDRLDHTRDLERLTESSAADFALADVLAGLAGVPAPSGVPLLRDELARIAASIREHAVVAPTLPRSVVGKALATLDDAVAELDDRGGWELELVHWDLHYANVLAGLPDAGGGRWLAIDPLPRAGFREAEVVAPLRNRWSDAVATGDPDAALRCRLDLLCESAGLHRRRAAAFAQAVAVDNVLWIRREGRLDSPFLAPYECLARW